MTDILDKPVTIHLEDLMDLLDLADSAPSANQPLSYQRIEQIADLVAQGTDAQEAYEFVMRELRTPLM